MPRSAFAGGSVELRTAYHDIHPRPRGMKVDTWLYKVGAIIGFGYERAKYYYYENRVSVSYEDQKLIESLLREIHRSKKTINEAKASLGTEDAHYYELVELLRKLDRAAINLDR